MTDAPKKTKQRKPNVGSDPTTGSRVWWWQIGMYVVCLGLAAMTLAITVIRLVQGQFSSGPAVTAVIMIGLSWMLLTSTDASVVSPGGIKLDSSEPALTTFLHSVADEIGAPRADAIHLVAEPLITINEEMRYFGLQHERRVLTVGLPYLHSLTKSELAAMAAHHFGHFADTDVDHSVRAMRALRAGSNLIATERSGAVNGVYGSYSRKIARSVGGVGAAQEAASERKAVGAYGTQAMLSGLHKLDDVAVAWDQMLRDYVVPALQSGAHPIDLFGGFEQLLASPQRSESRAADVERRQSAEGNEFDPHNSPGERLADVSTWEPVTASVVVPDGEALACTLLDPAEKSADIVVAKWARTLTDDATEPQSWHQLADEVFSVSNHNLVAAGSSGDADASPTEQFDAALAWSNAEWDELDDTLAGVKSLKRQEPAERRVAWARALVAEAAAATESFGWKMNWDGSPDLLNAAGQAFDATAVAELLIAGQSADARQAFDAQVSA